MPVCVACGYDLRGLPRDAHCPECGTDQPPEALAAQTAAWFASWNGLLCRCPPPAFLRFLGTPDCQRIFRRRTLFWWILPLGALAALYVLVGTFVLETVVERTVPQPGNPSVFGEPDLRVKRTRIFGGFDAGSEPYVTGWSIRTRGVRVRITANLGADVTHHALLLTIAVGLLGLVAVGATSLTARSALSGSGQDELLPDERGAAVVACRLFNCTLLIVTGLAAGLPVIVAGLGAAFFPSNDSAPAVLAAAGLGGMVVLGAGGVLGARLYRGAGSGARVGERWYGASVWILCFGLLVAACAAVPLLQCA